MNTPSIPVLLTGYRPLNAQELALCNLVKQHGASFEALFASIDDYLKTQYGEADGPEGQRIDRAEPRRWMSISRTHVQQGLMALVRAVTQPTV